MVIKNEIKNAFTTLKVIESLKVKIKLKAFKKKINKKKRSKVATRGVLA